MLVLLYFLFGCRFFSLSLFLVVRLHNLFDIAGFNPFLQRCSHFCYSCFDGGFVIALEGMQYMVDNCLVVACRVADADFKARVSIGAQMLGNGFDAVVAAGAAFATDAQLAYGHIHIILDNSDIIRVDVIEVGVGTYGNTAEVHVGGRLDD